MMTTRSALASRLQKLEQPAKRPDGQRAGVLQLPRRLSVDEWQAIAEPQQARLAQQTREGVC